MSRTIINFSHAAGINFFHFREVLIGSEDVIFFQDLQSSVSVYANFFQDQQISDSMGVDCKESSDSAGLNLLLCSGGHHVKMITRHGWV
jgi:hypothetical protein